MTRQVRDAAQSDEALCTAIDTTFAMAPKVEAALEAGADRTRIEQASKGLKLDSRPVSTDWAALSFAVGPGKASTAMVSLGGLGHMTGENGCLDVAKMRRWVGRAPTFRTAPDCVKERLIPRWKKRVEELTTASCLCAVPERDPLPGMVSAIGRIDLPDLAATLTAWKASERWKACEPTATPAP